MSARSRKGLVYGLSATLSVVGLLFLLRGLDVERLKATFQTVDPRFFALSLLITLVSQFIPPLRWRVLLGGAITFWRSCGALFVGNFVSALVPLRMGEAARAGLIYRSQGIALTASLPTIITGQVMDVVSLLVLALALLMIAPLPPELLRASVILGAVTAVGLAAVAVMLRFMPAVSRQLEPLFMRVFGHRWVDPLKRIVQKVGQSLRILQNPRRLAYTIALSLAFWLMTALAGGGLAVSLGQEQVLLLGLMMAFAGGIGRLLPALPGSIGTLDAAVMIGLTALGVGETEALTLVLLLRLRYTLMIAVIGVIGFLIEGRFSLYPVISEPAE